MMKEKYAETLEALCERVLTTRGEVGDSWPYYSDPKTGSWYTTDDGDWCDGHWIDMLRMTGELTGRRELIDEALERTEQVRYKLEKDDQFRGHRFYYSAARLWETEKDEPMQTLALAAAYSMRSMALRVNGGMPVGKEVQVKSTDVGSRTLVAVDNVHPNLMLDWWAYRQTGDERFPRGAKRMFELLEEFYIRPDGSTKDFIDFDPVTGEPVDEFTLFCNRDESCWSRGQAWVVAGSLIAYENTDDPYYLDICRKTFDYWWNESGPEAPPYDFMEPNRTNIEVDTSASGIVTSALARQFVYNRDDERVARYIQRLEPMLDDLCSRVTPLNDTDSRPKGMLLNGCFNQPKKVGHNHELLWGNFYLMETLYCLEKGGLPS